MSKLHSKKISETIHTRRRADQRFGLNLNREKRMSIIRMIQKNQTTPLERRSLSRSKHLVEIDGVLITVVYDKIRKNLVTVLPTKQEPATIPVVSLPS